MDNDYRTMEAGRELDRLIAERLGWTRFDTMPTVLVEHDNHIDIETLMGWKNDFYYLVVPHYSTDLNAAMTLLPTADGDIWSLHYGDYGDPYTVAISRIKVAAPEYLGDANTPALAICRAWLAWKDSQP